MNVLLDTHVWLWALEDNRRLGRAARRVLDEPANELWLSPVTLWEVGLLYDSDRLRIKGTFARWVEQALAALPTTEAPLNRHVAVAVREVGVPHQDPADRFIAATARVYDLTLLTADSKLLAGRGFKHIAAD